MITREPVNFENAFKFNIKSQIADVEFEIKVAMPSTFLLSMVTGKPYERFRVIYATDANIIYDGALARLRAQNLDVDQLTEPFILVGIGYPTTEFGLVQALRQREFSPPGTPGLHDEGIAYCGHPIPPGAADKFLRFIEDELDPLIRAELPCTDDRACYMGGSLGALFGLYALFMRSKAFDTYICVSPCITEEMRLIWSVEEACFNESDTLQARLFMALGERERTSLNDMMRRLSVGYDQMKEHLNKRSYKDLECHFREYPGGTHLSYGHGALGDGLNLLYPLKLG